MFSRENVKLLAVATVCILVSIGGPVAARATYDAMNAHKVDGKHAVGAGASIAQRKGKLVATSGTTGRLPNNIIAVAPDSAKLGGKLPAAYRFISLDPMSWFVRNGATVTPGYGPLGGVWLPDAGNPSVDFGFTIPPSYSGGTLKLRLLWHTEGSGCSVELAPGYVSVGQAGAQHNLGSGASDGMTGPGEVIAPAVPTTLVQSVFTLSSPVPSKALHAGDKFLVGLFRTTDSCTTQVVIGAASITW